MDLALRRRAGLIRVAWITVEWLIVAGSLFPALAATTALRYALGLEPLRPWTNYLPLAALAASAWSAALIRDRAYFSQRLVGATTQARRVLRTSAAVTGLLAVLLFVGGRWVSRDLVAVFCSFAVFFLLVERWALTRLRHRSRQHGLNQRYSLLVGDAAVAANYSRIVRSHPEWGIHLVGLLADPEDAAATEQAAPLLGLPEEVPRILDRHVVDELVLCGPLAESRLLATIIRAADARGLVVRLPLPDLERLGAREVVVVDGLPIATVTRWPEKLGAMAAKRTIDVAAAGVFLIMLSPLLLAIGAIVRVADGAPVLFRQQRVGRHGRVFTLWKFRTMTVNAHDDRATLASSNQIAGPAFKMRGDPRLTRTGRWLRRWSLDELPQLFNVLQGDMSLVGPRPPLPEEVRKYKDEQRRRLSMKPGMTGLWQISGRAELPFERWVELDLAYIDSWSIKTDLQILARTVPEVLRGRGAM